MNLTQVPAKWFTSGRFLQRVDTIVVHWMDTTLAGADNVFTGKTARQQVSAHFGVEDTNVHQYVRLSDTAYHAGNWLVNLRSVGIEHSAEPGRDATDATYETSSELIVEICKQLSLIPSRSLLKKHSEIVPTQCPGTIDLDRLARRAVELWNDHQDINVAPASPANLAIAHVPVTFSVKVTVPVARLRTRQDLQAPIIHEVPLGTVLIAHDTIQGDMVNGDPVWYRVSYGGNDYLFISDTLIKHL